MGQEAIGAVARTRALLTERDRELLADDDAGDRRYQAVSEVRSRIYEELGQDVQILEQHHRGLLNDLYGAVGPIFYCPVCGDGSPRLNEVLSHAIGTMDGQHNDIGVEEMSQLAPEWWAEHAPAESADWLLDN